MHRSTGPRGVPLTIYQHLLEINAGFEQVRVAIASYSTGVIETEETDEAGRLFRLRRARERREDASGD